MTRLTKEKMDEQSPLITTINYAPRRQRSRQSTIRRFCTIAFFSTFLAAAFVFLFDPRSLSLDKPKHHSHQHPSKSIPFEELQEILLSTPKEEKAQEWSKYYTSGPHLAGKNFSQALWTREKWEEFGVRSEIVAYDTYINYPLGHRLALYEQDKTKAIDGAVSWKVKFEASLEEDVLEEDPTSGLESRVPTFHGYSASGNVTGSFVYVNYGTYQDYEDLLKANVSLVGKIAIARYGGIFRGLKIKRAQDLGMIGTVLFTDPGDDGLATEENGVDTYPNGPARHPTSVQRGSAQFLSVAPGDPTTPGYPSKPGVPREPTEGKIPEIPSIPISYVDALPILTALNGHGPSAKDLGKYWNTNLGLAYKGVKYNVGPSPDNLALNLVNEQEYVTTPLWNVIGVINGTLSNEVVVIGNHRDAWIAGGAGDPNSGSAALNEVIRSFGVALAKGWKPLRTIVFASWDGEEYGLIGSTEWVEEFLPWLTEANVAYINVDVATTGPIFGASAAPLLNKLLYEVSALIPSPNQTVAGQTIYDLWDKKISTMGSGSDFTAFQDFAGIPSLDFGFHADMNAPGGPPVYQYHSNYDSFYWMNTYGDPGFHYHIAAAKILALITAKVAETPIIPLNATDYALAIQGYIGQVEDKLDATMAGTLSIEEEAEARARPVPVAHKGDAKALKHSFKTLHHAAHKFIIAAKAQDAFAAELAEQVEEGLPWWKWYSKAKLWYNVVKVNKKYKFLEREFLYQEGLDGRTWFKHVVFAPGLWTGYAGAVFPGIVEGIEASDWESAEKWVEIVATAIKGAAKSLR